MGVRKVPWGQEGAALVFALAVLLLVALAAHAALAVLAYEARASATARESAAAFQVAEAGLERATFELARDPDWRDARGATALADPSGVEWRPLCLDPGSDGACRVSAESVAFLAGDPLGNFTVRMKLRAGTECGEEGCVCVRSTGQARGAVRRVEAVVSRDRAGEPVRVVAWREVLAEHDPMRCGRG
ncbi:MAG: hypothetical protein RMM30_10715 [Armatimonadota bacterium]|nr:hypothetical protein [Armatimonadota bacterium]MDW8157040.1 hypothetical protein [Armatimonadota bacterium]